MAMLHSEWQKMLFITTVIASLLPLSLCFSFSRAFMPLSKDVRIKVHIGKFQISSWPISADSGQ